MGTGSERKGIYFEIEREKKFNMEDIIAPVDKALLKAELTADKRLRYTNKSHNEI